MAWNCFDTHGFPCIPRRQSKPFPKQAASDIQADLRSFVFIMGIAVTTSPWLAPSHKIGLETIPRKSYKTDTWGCDAKVYNNSPELSFCMRFSFDLKNLNAYISGGLRLDLKLSLFRKFKPSSPLPPYYSLAYRE